jgi:hypothetical protein
MTTILEGASKSDSNNILMALLIILIVIGIAYFIYYLYIQNTNVNKKLANNLVHEEENHKMLKNIQTNIPKPTQTTIPSTTQNKDSPKYVFESFDNPSQETMQKMPVKKNNENEQNGCFPKEQLTADELLPTDNSSLWAQVNPSGEGSFKDKNFLQSGYHIGINTVGQTLRNANLQLRSEPACPQVKVSPWLQATIEPDLGRKPFEIGGCA